MIEGAWDGHLEFEVTDDDTLKIMAFDPRHGRSKMLGFLPPPNGPLWAYHLMWTYAEQHWAKTKGRPFDPDLDAADVGLILATWIDHVQHLAYPEGPDGKE